ncbi:hypothetical protein DJ68_10315 [Halorubrum sp. C3]|nr:hypothetical protein DJ68_10315 [Halorubrum sp. C3]
MSTSQERGLINELLTADTAVLLADRIITRFVYVSLVTLTVLVFSSEAREHSELALAFLLGATALVAAIEVVIKVKSTA